MKGSPDDLLKIAEITMPSASSSTRCCQAGSADHLKPFHTRINSGHPPFPHTRFHS